MEVIIVDNGSKDNAVFVDLTRMYEGVVSVVSAGSNLGYFGAAYYGLCHYLKGKEYPEVVVICNTDMSLAVDFFAVLRNKIGSEKFEVLGPSIFSDFLNYYQNPYMINRIKKSKLHFLEKVSASYVLYSFYTLFYLLKSKLLKTKVQQNTHKMSPYAVHGSCMIFSKSFFQKGGTIQYPCVLFGEELFIAEQVLQLKMKMVYEPDLRVIHHEHATTGVFKSRKSVSFLKQSYTFLLKTYFN